MLNIKPKINGRNNIKNISYHNQCEKSEFPNENTLSYSVRQNPTIS